MIEELDKLINSTDSETIDRWFSEHTNIENPIIYIIEQWDERVQIETIDYLKRFIERYGDKPMPQKCGTDDCNNIAVWDGIAKNYGNVSYCNKCKIHQEINNPDLWERFLEKGGDE